ncbi:MAG: hypothetical protein ACR2NO_03965 [Chloroflexota bacterium]
MLSRAWYSPLTSLLLFAILAGAAALLVDIAAGLNKMGKLDVRWPGWWVEWAQARELAVTDSVRIEFLRDVARFALPSALLTTMAAFAIPALTPYANPGVLLRYRTHQPAWANKWVIGYFFGRTNYLYLVLIGAMGLTGAALTLGLRHLFTGNAPFVLTLALVAVAALTVFVQLLQFVLWVLDMRVPSAVLAHVCDAALRHVEYVRRDRTLRHRRRADHDPEAIGLEFEEQHELRLLLEGIAQIAIISAREEQLFVTVDATRALREVHDALLRAERGRELPDLWFEVRNETGPPQPQKKGWPASRSARGTADEAWSDRILVQALSVVIGQALTTQTEQALERAGDVVVQIGVDALQTDPRHMRPRHISLWTLALDALLASQARCRSAGNGLPEAHVRERLQALLSLPDQYHYVSPQMREAAVRELHSKLPSLAAELFGASAGDTEKLAWTLDVLAAVPHDGELRRSLVAAAIEALGSMHAHGRDEHAATLYSWLASLDASGEEHGAYVSGLSHDAVPAHRSSSVTPHDLQLELVVAGARGVALNRWSARARRAAAAAFGQLPNAATRSTAAIERLTRRPSGSSLTRARWLSGLVELIEGA